MEFSRNIYCTINNLPVCVPQKHHIPGAFFCPSIVVIILEVWIRRLKTTKRVPINEIYHLWNVKKCIFPLCFCFERFQWLIPKDLCFWVLYQNFTNMGIPTLIQRQKEVCEAPKWACKSFNSTHNKKYFKHIATIHLLDKFWFLRCHEGGFSDACSQSDITLSLFSTKPTNLLKESWESKLKWSNSNALPQKSTQCQWHQSCSGIPPWILCLPYFFLLGILCYTAAAAEGTWRTPCNQSLGWLLLRRCCAPHLEDGPTAKEKIKQGSTKLAKFSAACSALPGKIIGDDSY